MFVVVLLFGQRLTCGLWSPRLWLDKLSGISLVCPVCAWQDVGTSYVAGNQTSNTLFLGHSEPSQGCA